MTDRTKHCSTGYTYTDLNTHTTKRKVRMYRSSRQSKAPLNPYDHVQRSRHARAAIVKRRLSRDHNGRNRLTMVLFTACALVLLIGAALLFAGGDVSSLIKSDASGTGSVSEHIDFGSISDNKQRHGVGAVDSSISLDASQTADDDDGTPEIAQKLDEELAKTDSTPDAHNEESASKTVDSDTESEALDKCSFRTYQPHRYYPVDDLDKPFLRDSSYIRGQLPFVINPRTSGNGKDVMNGNVVNSSMPKKLCVDTSEWEGVKPGYRPFSDGQNPSFVSLASDAYGIHDDDHSRIERSTIEPLAQIYGSEDINNMYLGLLLFGSSLCKWNMTEEEVTQQKLSPLEDAPSKRSMVLVLNESLDPIGEAVLKLEHDARWGEKRKKYPKKATADGKGFERSIVELDDARLFFHNGRLHVLYRNGPSFGYEKQVQNPIHITAVGENKFEAVIKASESFTVCCGRNISFISELPTSADSDGISHNDTPSEHLEGDLFALTWIDPVTADLVHHPKAMPASRTGRKLRDTGEIVLGDSIPRRRLGKREKVKKSTIHGTNGYLVPLHSSDELLGIAHFHRPEHRETSRYARHGHHYTHAFFTIQGKKKSGDGEEDHGSKFKLKRISNEFVFMSPTSSNDKAADVIQFASGLDLVGTDKDGKLMISYGINDCEGAVVFLDMDKVQNLLIPVKDGEEVVHLMDKLVT